MRCALIGILDDGWAGLSDSARARLAAAQLVIGAARTLALVDAHLDPATHRQPLDGALGQVPEQVRAALAAGRRVAVLATGDPLCHGLGGRLAAAIGPAAVEVLPNLSTLQLACARLHRPWQDARITSCHGPDAGDWPPGATPDHPLYPVVQAVGRARLTLAFTSPDNGPDRLARALLTVGYQDELRLSVAARLARPDEALFPDLTLAAAAERTFPMPNLVLIDHHPTPAEPLFGLPDAGFAQQRAAGAEAGLITKQEVRAVSLARLRLHPDSLIWDIGAGSGSVGLEAGRIAHAGHVFAAERDPARAAQARANARRLRAGNYSLCETAAPAGLTAWPDPDAVFIGGSGGALADLIALVGRRLRPAGRLVLNLVTLENLATATAALDKAGLTWELIQLGVARGQPIRTPEGRLHRLAALNPVWVVTAHWGASDHAPSLA